MGYNFGKRDERGFKNEIEKDSGAYSCRGDGKDSGSDAGGDPGEQQLNKNGHQAENRKRARARSGTCGGERARLR